MDYLTRVRQRWAALFGRYEQVELVINGQRLTAEQIGQFQRLTGWPVVEPGHYWLDPTTGNMGMVGELLPRFNVFQQLQGGAVHGGGASLSQRRMLFNSADLTGIWGAY